MKTIITLGASTSKTSINKQFANYAGQQLNQVEIQNVDISQYNDLPIYSVDEEATNGTPDKIVDLNTQFKSVDGFILSFAEHNSSFSAGYKNVFDWISRQEGKVFNGKPVLLLSTSPGGRGGISVLNSALAIYPHHGADIIGSLALPSFYDNFSENGITEPELNANFSNLIIDFQNKI